MSRIDPTGLTSVSRKFAAQIKRRARTLANEVLALFASQDILERHPAIVPTTNAPLRLGFGEDWKFLRNPEKIRQFDEWFMGRAHESLLATTPSGEPWTEFFSRIGYERGLTRGYVDSQGKKFRGGAQSFFAGSKQEYLRRAMADAHTREQIRFLATRSYEELRGFTKAMGSQLNRILANSIVMKKSPKKIAQEMVKKIKGMTEQRAMAIARSECTAAFAQATLDALEDLGETEVGACVAWETVGDDRVCKKCQELEGKIFTIDEARGMLPLHVACRCAWVPSECIKKRKRRKK